LDNAPNKTSNRMTIIGFLLLFTLPVIVAWSAYFNGWFTDINTTNKGQWVNPVIDLTALSPVTSDDQALSLEQGGKWRLIIPMQTSQCVNEQEHKPCLLNLFLIGQAHKAMGREIERIERVLYVGDQAIDQQEIERITERFVDLVIVKGKPQQVFEANRIYLSDPIGNVILMYPFVDKQEDAFIKGRDIVKDLKKLLKLSRIG
jgi:hypothetical protein